jgi:diguanylate cyclase (GGDEF)-like protein
MAIIIGVIFSSAMRSTLSSEVRYDAGQQCHETVYALEKNLASDIRVVKTLAAASNVRDGAAEYLPVLQSSTRLSKFDYIALQWNDAWYMVTADGYQAVNAPSGISHDLFSAVLYGYLYDGEAQGLLVVEPLADGSGVSGKLVAKRSIEWLSSIAAQEDAKNDIPVLLALNDGQIIYPDITNGTMSSETTEEGSSIVVTSSTQTDTYDGLVVTLTNAPLVVSTYVDLTAVDKKMEQYVRNYLIFASCGLAFISIIVYAISSVLTRAIIELARYTEKVELTGARMPAKFTRRNDEAGVLARSFALMMNKVSGSLGKMRHMAYHDNLTSLKNRYSLEQDIDKMISVKGPFAFALMDIDDFKIINDMMGHAEGDRLLICIARIFESLESDTLKAYRWGGDEFAFILTGEGRSGYQKDIEKVLSEVAARFDSNNKWRISVSAGLCLFPDSATDYSRLLVLADQALILAKRSGKARYRFYEDI